jgi:thiol:disulfide interchange protein DsbA
MFQLNLRSSLAPLLLVAFANAAMAGDFESSFQPLRPPQPTQVASGKIEVVEVFSYGCPHCYSLEPYLKRWLETKPDDVEFIRIPVLNRDWLPHARAYYAADKLGVIDKLHGPLFEALHREQKPIRTEQDLHRFAGAQGIDAAKFEQAYKSNEIDTRLRLAHEMLRGYKVTGTPSLIVNGKYLTSGALAGSFENMIQVIDQLVEMERSVAAN